jgi:inner membrane protein
MEEARQGVLRVLRGHAILIKLTLLAALTLAMLVPLGWVRNLVAERAALSEQVEQELGASWGAEQRLAGPILAVPFEWRETERVSTGKTEGEPEGFVEKSRQREAVLYLLPETQVFTAVVDSRTRKRGVYSALLYTAEVEVAGSFRVASADAADLPDGARLRWDKARLAVHLTDLRGNVAASTLRWGERDLPFENAAEPFTLKGSWIAAKLPRPTDGESSLSYRFSLTLNGSRGLALVPLGHSSEASLSLDWPHPSFVGWPLPLDHTIGPEGAVAHWSQSHLARDLPSALRSDRGGLTTLMSYVAERGFETRLVDPVDFYRKALRAVKYGLLFIVVTFATLISFEVTGRRAAADGEARPLHVMQYALVALALALFFLLLLSLAEVIGFAAAYWTATGLCLGLVGLYTAKVTASARRGLGLSGCLLGIYGYLYMTLQSEDYALLIGSLLLFLLLAAMMFVTRNVDWFRLGLAAGPSVADESPAGQSRG